MRPLALASTLVLALSARAAPRCPARATELVVVTAEHLLLECERGREVASHRVALGSGGIGKRVRGDAKTPLGVYPLGAPRGSTSFHVFIPVGYPTAAQRAKGFTGSDVGVHGPSRAWRFAGAANVAVDWTLGCIAVATDAEIDAIARWVRTRHITRIELL